MPILLPEGLPAARALRAEGIGVASAAWGARAAAAGPALRIALLNLMPDKPTAETQFARLLGAAQVLTTVSSQAKANHALAAGADAAILYRVEDVAARVKELTGGHGVDRVVELDLAGNAASLPALLAPGGPDVREVRGGRVGRHALPRHGFGAALSGRSAMRARRWTTMRLQRKASVPQKGTEAL